MNPKTCLAWAALACAVPLSAQGGAASLKAKAQNVPEIPFEASASFLKMPPNLYLGEGIGVATNSKGHVFVYTRSQATRLFEFDAKGNYLREIGEGLYGFAFAHAVRVDPGQHLGRRRGYQHGHQVQPPGPRHHGSRPPARVRRSHPRAAA